ncbi:MAG: SLC13 family permease [Bacteroidaceae bacterium]|nr:SLC13 family permease [Bacteroidaceae bacterium]
MAFPAFFVVVVLFFIVLALIKERMRPGLILLSGAVVFLCAGILTPKDMLEGFSNKGMITVALLFLVSEGVRRSGLLETLLARLLPARKTSVRRVQMRMLPTIAFVSAFLNNTPVVVIFAPMVKRWAERVHVPATKLLIPLSYATILGGVCTLIGTSTNLVVHGMIIDAGFEGFTMFELGKVGLIIAAVGLAYIFLVSKYLLPDRRADVAGDVDYGGTQSQGTYKVEVVLGARFPAINRRIRDFDFARKYGATLLEIRRGGVTMIMHDMRKERFREGDTLVLLADDAFMQNWGDSSFFLMVSDGRESEPSLSPVKRWTAVVLMALMIVGAAIGELPQFRGIVPGMKFDMFFFVCVTTIIMAWMNIFPARKYTKYISWDILVTIASAFAISKAMQNSGMADAVARFAIGLSNDHPNPYLLLGVVFVITNLFTELMTNNAAAALSFPISLAIAQHLGVSPTPFFVVICIAASASFSTPIGYQTNLIVQGIGNYRFSDFVRVGLPLNIIALLLSVLLVPSIWPF